MSAYGPKRTFQHRHPMSASGGKADIFGTKATLMTPAGRELPFHVRYWGGKADFVQTSCIVCFFRLAARMGLFNDFVRLLDALEYLKAAVIAANVRYWG